MSDVVKKDTVEWPMGFGGAIVNRVNTHKQYTSGKKDGKKHNSLL